MDPPQGDTPVLTLSVDSPDHSVPHISAVASPTEPEDVSRAQASSGPETGMSSMDTMDTSADESQTQTTESPDRSTEPSAESDVPQTLTDEATPPEPPAPAEEVEHAYWAEIEEDHSAPDEAELKDIESADGDYSAFEYDYWEKSFYREVDDPEFRPAEKARLTWKFKGVRGTKDQPNRAKIMRSPAAYIGGYWWTIKFFPRGNSVGALSIYIECSPEMPKPDKELPETEFKVLRGSPDAVLSEQKPDFEIKFPRQDDSSAWFDDYKSRYPIPQSHSSDFPVTGDASQETSAKKDWRVSAQIGVILYNPEEPRTGWMQSSCHQFNQHNLDWGWTNFHGPWDKIHQRQRGQRQALLRNDTLAFDAYIRVFDDPTQSLWWHSSDSEPVWDSLSLTGYRPIGDSVINHSAEVAGLASWLFIAPFRKLLQSVDVLEHFTDVDKKPKPLCEALQKFLWLLRTQSASAPCVHTDAVTATLRNLHEYSGDVMEFWERLRRSLGLELAGTEAAKEFARLFDSPAVDPAANRLPSETNSLIRVPADQAKTVQGALDKYFSEKPGRWSLPTVLHVELGRQRFDKRTRQWKLLYDRVDPDEVLDLSAHVVEGQCPQYDLYGLVIHRGRRTSGKFFSILRPGGPGTRWLAFDDGSDNRVECLTRKAALEAHIGLDPTKSKETEGKAVHDVAVVVMYIRKDVVQEYLTGKPEPWEITAPVKKYFETTQDPRIVDADDKKPVDISVEVYSLPHYDQLPSLFDSYDLMSQAKAANHVMYMTVPHTTSIVELRKRIALWKSNDTDKIPTERIRLWQVGQTKELFGPTVLLNRVVELDDYFLLKTARLWVHVLSEDDAKLFGLVDPPAAPSVSEDKPEETIQERAGSESSDDRDLSPATEDRTPDSNSTPRAADEDAPARAAEQPPEEAAQSSDEPTADVNMDEIMAANVEAVAAVIAGDIQEMDAEPTPPANSQPEDGDIIPPEDLVMEDSQASGVAEQEHTDNATPVRPLAALPVPHVYYFIQVFDVKQQVLRTVGSYISRMEDNIRSALRTHLQWPENKDFLVWQRIDGTTVSAVSPADTFEAPVHDGTCFIVGDRLSKDQRSEIGSAGCFTNPDRLVQYLWASSRNHPTLAFTGTKTIDAGFSGDYYSGDFNKGYYHGKGTHISDSGATYVGDFIFGQRHGSGTMEYPSGDTYSGDWLEDQRDGQGTFVERKTGNKYVGGYRDGKRHGKGISYWEVADEEMDLCQICYGEEQDALFYDCGHVCACVTCARQVDTCPICRKNVISVVKIYRT
ncbi:conserved hypothetical protein [Paecilomyces variotii No. 5]|uniref:MATH and UCH domain protein n=1 Tax=Byssochlamys spectabilis (strain No. 5 / NBRC 109023) TaxID=1356009 RepID=V5G641_BYSSN|nr:conserved hypothetical protein [Paecilomyces variotii No. 5]